MSVETLNSGLGSVDLKARPCSPRQLHTPLQDLFFPPFYVAPAMVINARFSSFKAPTSQVCT